MEESIQWLVEGVIKGGHETVTTHPSVTERDWTDLYPEFAQTQDERELWRWVYQTNISTGAAEAGVIALADRVTEVYAKGWRALN